MNQKSEHGLYEVLEEELKRAKEPMDCVMLFDRQKVRDHASTVNRVSDYLGNMWRKGQVLRLPAPRNEGTKARWMYVWKDKPKAKPDVSRAIAYDEKVDQILSRPQLDISEDERQITIMLNDWVITIQKKQAE